MSALIYRMPYPTDYDNKYKYQQNTARKIRYTVSENTAQHEEYLT